MCQYIVIWFNQYEEVARDSILDATSKQDAIAKAHMLYPVGKYPAPFATAILDE